MRFRFIEDCRADCPLTILCDVLGVAPTGYYGWRSLPESPRSAANRFPIPPNLLDRNFTAAAPNRTWLADITYIETDQGSLYLTIVMDLYSRRMVGWAIADHLRAELSLAALRMVISVQRPGSGLIHHSDRGVKCFVGVSQCDAV
uniref:DDE-type integrase/transposase/recombinase n=1 Tax=Rhizobium lupini TaxID=136996 RepID=UPI003F64B543